jgi:hypothetical protein
MKKHTHTGANSLIAKNVAISISPSESDRSIPELNRIVDRFEELTSLQRDYIFAIKKKLDNLSYVGGTTGEESEDKLAPVTINEKLNEVLEHQNRNSKQLEIILNFLNTML